MPTHRFEFRIFKFLLVALAFSFTLTDFQLAEAQQSTKVRRIGFLMNTGTPYHEAFRQRLRELGYVEGQNLIVETRYAEGKRERLQGLATELVGLGVEVIVVGGPAVSAAAQATKKIPNCRWQRHRSGGFGFGG